MDGASVAWIVWAGTDSGYTASLEWLDEAPVRAGTGPDLVDLDEYVSWARDSAKMVIVRPEWDSNVAYDATIGEPGSWRRLRWRQADEYG